MANSEIQFCLTAEQQEQFNAFFEQIQNTYLSLQGLDYMATIRRLGLIAFRIAMILSTLRIMEHGDLPERNYLYTMKSLFILLFLSFPFLSNGQSYTDDMIDFQANQPRRYEVTYKKHWTNLYGDMLQAKRQQYDQGRAYVQNKMNDIAELPSKIFGYGKVPQDVAEKTQKDLNDFVYYCNAENPDFSESSVVQRYYGILKRLEENVYIRARKHN